MADDVQIQNSGTPFNAATDEIGGRHFQMIKLVVSRLDQIFPLTRRIGDTYAATDEGILSLYLDEAGTAYLTPRVNADTSLRIKSHTVASAGAYQQLTVSSTAVALTVPGGSKFALIRVSVAAVRFRDDGTNPTGSLGVPLNPGDSIDYDGPLSAIKFIRAGGTDATLDILYYK